MNKKRVSISSSELTKKSFLEPYLEKMKAEECVS